MAITFLNSTALTIGTAASTWSIPTHSSRMGGAAVVVGVGCSSAVTVSTVTDNAGNTYTFARRALSPRTVGAEIWYALNASSNSTRISITFSGTSSGSVAVSQWPGVSTANALIGSGSTAIVANSTTHDAVEVLPVQSSAAVITYARMNASTIGTVTAGASMTAWTSTNAAVRQFGQYWIQGAASTTRGRFTTSSNCQHSAVIIVLSDTNTAIPIGTWSMGLMGVQ